MELSPKQEEEIDIRLTPYVEAIAAEIGLDPDSPSYESLKQILDDIRSNIAAARLGRPLKAKIRGTFEIPKRTWDTNALIDGQVRYQLRTILNRLVEDHPLINKAATPDQIYAAIIEAIQKLQRTKPSALPSRALPSRAAPSKAAPSKAAPSKAAPSKAAPSKALIPPPAPSRAVPSRTEPSRVVPSRAPTSRISGAPSRRSPTRTVVTPLRPPTAQYPESRTVVPSRRPSSPAPLKPIPGEASTIEEILAMFRQ